MDDSCTGWTAQGIEKPQKPNIPSRQGFRKAGLYKLWTSPQPLMYKSILWAYYLFLHKIHYNMDGTLNGRKSFATSSTDPHNTILKIASIYSTHLYDQRPIFSTNRQVVPSIVGVSIEHGGVQHGRIAQFSTVPPAQHPPRQLRLVHHWGNDVLSSLEHVSPQFVPRVSSSHLSQNWATWDCCCKCACAIPQSDPLWPLNSGSVEWAWPVFDDIQRATAVNKREEVWGQRSESLQFHSYRKPKYLEK